MRHRLRPLLLSSLQLLLLAGLAFALRHWAWNWDQGQMLHPDERFLIDVTHRLAWPDSLRSYFDTGTSPLNPHTCAQSRFVYGTLPLWFLQALRTALNLQDWADLFRAGRLLSALWATGTVLLLARLATQFGSRAFAWFPALWLALTPLCLQLSRFYTVDTAGAFFATATLLLGVKALQRRNPGWLPAAGLCAGLAMACRLNLGLLLPWLLLVTASLKFRARSPGIWPCVTACLLLALLAFRIAQPYAFAATGFLPHGLNPDWTEGLRMEHAIVRGSLEVPYTLQWIQTPPFFLLRQLIRWGMAPPVGLLAVLGSLSLLWQLRRDPGHPLFLLLLWPVMLLGYHQQFFLQTQRYALPAYPVLLLGGALALRRIPRRKLRVALAWTTTAAAALFAAAFLNLYRQPHSRIQASEWIYAEFPFGATVSYEIWDDPLPLRLPGHEAAHAAFTFVGLPVFDPDTPEKAAALIGTLSSVDLLVLSSTRAHGTLPRFPDRYPMSARFYDLLFAGGLGFEPAHEVRLSPGIGRWRRNTLSAEEAFRVYDHPRVLLFRRSPAWDPAAALDALTRDIAFDDIPDIRFTEAYRWHGGWFTAAQRLRRQDTRIFARRFHPDSPANRNPLLTWILILFFLGLLCIPLAHTLFPSLPDRGLFLRRNLAVLLLAYLAWLPAALEWIPFDLSLTLALLLLLFTNGLLFAFRQERILHFCRRHWRMLLFGEAVWWSVFAGFLFLRWLQPELWHPWAGGEKPMNLAFLNANALTNYFPAHQPWLSEAFINYYDFGYVLLATLIRLTGIRPEVAYNLAQPTLAAFTAGAVLSLTAALAPLLRCGRGTRPRFAAGLTATLFTLLLGNFAQIRWMLFERNGHSRDGYWNATRALRVPHGEVIPITEFPFFTLLYGDLHAHLIALPLAILTLLASWQLLRRPGWRPLLCCGFLLGVLRATNTWDFPIQAAIFCFAAAFPLLRAAPANRPAAAWTATGRITAGLLLSQLLFAPFHRHFLSYPARFLWWDGPRSRLIDLVLVHGLFLLPLTLLLPPLCRNPRLRHAPRPHRLFLCALLAGCLLTLLLLEGFTLAGDIGRMNTVFKFTFQLWWILAILTALALTAAWQSLRNPVSVALATLLLGLGLLYPFTAVPAKLRDRYWTHPPRGLDGFAYLDTAVWRSPTGDLIPLRHDAQVIRWLRRHAHPLDIILEAHLPQDYLWGGRISWHTGNPTLLGWNWHMRQQRPRPGADAVVHRRAREIHTLYTHPDTPAVLELARRRNIRFIIFSELERLTYGPEAQDRFETHPAFTPVYRYGTAVIYALSPPP